MLNRSGNKFMIEKKHWLKIRNTNHLLLLKRGLRLHKAFLIPPPCTYLLEFFTQNRLPRAVFVVTLEDRTHHLLVERSDNDEQPGLIITPKDFWNHSGSLTRSHRTLTEWFMSQKVITENRIGPPRVSGNGIPRRSEENGRWSRRRPAESHYCRRLYWIWSQAKFPTAGSSSFETSLWKLCLCYETRWWCFSNNLIVTHVFLQLLAYKQQLLYWPLLNAKVVYAFPGILIYENVCAVVYLTRWTNVWEF